MNFDLWMPMYWADFLSDTLHMTRADLGSYALMLGAYWRNHGPLPDDDESLRMICRCDLSEWTRTKGVLVRHFKIEGGLWSHDRLDKELSRSREIHQKRCNQTKAANDARNVQRNVKRNNSGNVCTITSTGTVQGNKNYPVGDGEATLRLCLEWAEFARSNGADYTDTEVKNAFNGLQQTGWMVGKSEVVDYRAAIERQIQFDRTRKPTPPIPQKRRQRII